MRVQLNTGKLDALIKSFKHPPVCQVGILGGKNQRKGRATNAVVGAAHEFGAPARGLPQRSFLRMPLALKLNEQLQDRGAFDNVAAKHVIEAKSLKPWMKKVGLSAVAVILDAFDSSGFGNWPSLKQSTMNKKKTKQILVETQQLRDSITSRVVDANR